MRAAMPFLPIAPVSTLAGNDKSRPQLYPDYVHSPCVRRSVAMMFADSWQCSGNRIIIFH
jgi:hypothetical protein